MAGTGPETVPPRNTNNKTNKHSTRHHTVHGKFSSNNPRNMEILGPNSQERVYDSEFGCRMYEVWKYDYELCDTQLAKYHCCFAKYLRVLEQPK